MTPRRSPKNGSWQSPILTSIGTWQTKPMALRSPIMTICQRSAASPPLNTIRRQFLYTCLNRTWCGMRSKRRGILQRARSSTIWSSELREDEYIMLLLTVHLVFFPSGRNWCTWYLRSWCFSGIIVVGSTIDPLLTANRLCFAAGSRKCKLPRCTMDIRICSMH